MAIAKVVAQTTLDAAAEGNAADIAPKMSLAFDRVSRAVREAILAETKVKLAAAKLLAGPTPPRARSRVKGPDPYPLRTRARKVVLETAQVTGRAAMQLREELDQRLADADIEDALENGISIADLVERLAADLGVTLDLSRQPDDVIGLLQWRDETLDSQGRPIVPSNGPAPPA